MGATDLHCHLLPGVDDGPATLSESLAYAASAVAAGTETIVATPHVEQVDVAELPDRVGEVRTALAREEIALRVEVGGELKPESLGLLSDADLETIAHGPPGARWLLFEVPFSGVDEAFLAGVVELRERGFGVLCAHPERSHGVLERGLDALAPVLDAGGVVATNVAPLRGEEGEEREQAAIALVRAGVPTVLATDAHPPRRPFQLADGAATVESLTGDAALAGRLTVEAPARLLRAGLPANVRESGP